MEGDDLAFTAQQEPNLWRHFSLHLEPSSATPPLHFPDKFAWRCTTCIRILMAFYGILLKVRGLLWSQWFLVTTKRVLPADNGRYPMSGSVQRFV